MFLASIEAAPASFREPGDRIALDCTPLHWATHWLGLGACCISPSRLESSACGAAVARPFRGGGGGGGAGERRG